MNTSSQTAETAHNAAPEGEYRWLGTLAKSPRRAPRNEEQLLKFLDRALASYLKVNGMSWLQLAADENRLRLDVLLADDGEFYEVEVADFTPATSRRAAAQVQLRTAEPVEHVDARGYGWVVVPGSKRQPKPTTAEQFKDFVLNAIDFEASLGRMRLTRLELSAQADGRTALEISFGGPTFKLAFWKRASMWAAAERA